MKTGDKIIFVKNTEGCCGVTIGKIYTVTKIHGVDPYIIDDNGTEGWYAGSQFDVVNNVDDDLLINIKLAKILIGKVIMTPDGATFVPDTFGVGNIYGQHYTDQLNKNGLVVYVENQETICRVDDAVIITNNIKITDDYVAIVEKDVVKVGCQNIPIKKVREILELWETLHG